MLAGNHKPTIKGADYGIWRRVQLIPFDVKIAEAQQDPELFQKLKTELPGILNWAVRGYQDWKIGGLNAPQIIVEQTEAYKQEEDRLADWMESCCDVIASGRSSNKKILASHNHYCAINHARPFSDKALYAALHERGFTKYKTGSERGFNGFNLTGVNTFGNSIATAA